MTRPQFTVGMNLGGRSRTVNVEAEDALIAALKVKHENSEAIINYVRKCNKRGDQRHPHKQLKNSEVAQPASRGDPLDTRLDCWPGTS